MAARAKTIDLDAVLPALRAALEREKALNAPALTKAGVPRAQQAAAFSRLEADGFERTPKAVRVPLRKQLLEALDERTQIALSQLGKAVRGATAKEVKTVAATLVSEGRAKTVLRGKIEILAHASAATLSREQLAALARACKLLAALAARAVRRDATVLQDDVREQLLEFVQPRKAPSLVDAAVAELGRHVRESVGLSFVPDTVRALSAHRPSEVQAAILEAARSGRIELQPDSGLDRLSQEELQLCPPGPRGTRLSWARLFGATP